MDDLRHDVNEAFDKRQHELGDLKGVPERMLLTARAARGLRADNRMRLAAGLAAVVIVALVIGTFAFVRAGILGSLVPASSPKPVVSPTPTALKALLNVPDSTPVILYQDPVMPMPRQFDGITWDGKLSGRVDWPVGVPLESLTLANRSRNLFVIGNAIMDRSARVLATGLPPYRFAWADDGQHLCLIGPGNPAILQLLAVGSPPRNVARIPLPQNSDLNTMEIAACSVLTDRAVVVQGNRGIQYWVIQLSTGKVLWSHRLNGPSIAIAVSPDGQYIAENAGGATPVTNGRTAPPVATIVGPDGSAVAHLSGWVEAFSWDGSLTVTHEGPSEPWGSRPVRIVRWSDGGIVWSAPDGFVLRSVAVEPRGTSMAIEVVALARLQPPYPGPRQGDLYVVAPDGRILAHAYTGFIANYFYQR